MFLQIIDNSVLHSLFWLQYIVLAEIPEENAALHRKRGILIVVSDNWDIL